MISSCPPVSNGKRNFKYHVNLTTQKDENGNFATIRLNRSDLVNKVAKKWGFHYFDNDSVVMYKDPAAMKEFMKDLNSIMPKGVKYEPDIPNYDVYSDNHTTYQILSNKHGTDMQILRYDHDKDCQLTNVEQVLDIRA